MKLDEWHLVQWAAVVRQGSVSQGAAFLGLSQPAVSRTIAVLEARVGAPLFVKGRRRIEPTALGRTLAGHGQAIMNAARAAGRAVSDFHDGNAGLVRIGGTPFFMDALVSRIIAEFHNVAPNVEVDQSYGYFESLSAALRADMIDLAICAIDQREHGSWMDFTPLIDGQNVVACRTTHPLMLRRSIEPAELLRQNWVAPPPDSPLHADLRGLLAGWARPI